MRNSSRRCENYFWRLFHIFVSIACKIYWCQPNTPPSLTIPGGGRQLELQLSMDWHNWQTLIEPCTMAVKICVVCLWYFNSARAQLHILLNYSWSSGPRETRETQFYHLFDSGGSTSGLLSKTCHKSSHLAYTLVSNYRVKFDHPLQVYLQAGCPIFHLHIPPTNQGTRGLLNSLTEITWHW